MTLYAWKITSAQRVYAQGIGALNELEAYLRESNLPMDRSPADIISFMKLMQFEGQSVYKFRHPTDPPSEWTLVWIELSSPIGIENQGGA